MRFTAAQVAEALHTAVAAGDEPITGWSVDSKTVQRGELFFARRGPSHDGHAYLADVFARGAAAAIVDHVPPGTPAGWKLLVVPDVQKALEDLGRWARAVWAGDVIALTGSAGKTTTKDIIAAMLATHMSVGKTLGNLNNHVGLPLSILRLDGECRAAVLEMGMNHAGEIAGLAAIAAPQTGVVTNVGYAHVENLGSLEGVAAAKRELIEALGENGTAVLNADDPLVAAFAKWHRGRVVTYGLSEAASVRGEDLRHTPEGLRMRVRGAEMASKLHGRHGASNLLAGIAVASLYGIEPEELRETVSALEPGEMRGRRFERNGILHIDDSYNSNPGAACAMIDLLAETPARRRIAVLGEMLELGDWSERLHRGVGRHAAKQGLHVLVGIRGAARHTVAEASAAGMPSDAAYFFEDPGEAGRFLKTIARPGDAILWKGSRGTRVEKALEGFQA